MSVMIYDSASQAFTEPQNVPRRYDDGSGAWADTTGKAYSQTDAAWMERWNTRVKAYVYGAALETVTIKKDGIIVATVDTDSIGQSAEQITLSKGTYTLTGSVSGHMEEQTVDKDTTKFRAMPEGALYWYGNECVDLTGGLSVDGYSRQSWGIYQAIKNSNYSFHAANQSSNPCYSMLGTNVPINLDIYTKIHVKMNLLKADWNACLFETTYDKVLGTDEYVQIGVQGDKLGFHEYIVDISALNGNVYAAILAQGNTSKYASFELYEVYFE